MAQMSLLTALTEKMRWHQQRQGLLAQNVANADTPGFQGKELKQLDFSSALAGVSLTPVSAAPGHISLTGGTMEVADAVTQPDFETTPEGNGVTLEDEMMKVTANQMDYQAVTSLYTKSLALIRTALGHPS